MCPTEIYEAIVHKFVETLNIRLQVVLFLVVDQLYVSYRVVLRSGNLLLI